MFYIFWLLEKPRIWANFREHDSSGSLKRYLFWLSYAAVFDKLPSNRIYKNQQRKKKSVMAEFENKVVLITAAAQGK